MILLLFFFYKLDCIYVNYFEFFFNFSFFEKFSSAIVYLENSFFAANDLILFCDLFDGFNVSLLTFLFDTSSSKLYANYVVDFVNYSFCLIDV